MYRALSDSPSLQSENLVGKPTIPATVPTIDFDLREHKVSIAINWTVLVVSSGILPILLYFVLRYHTNLEISSVLGVTSAIFGVVSLQALLIRTWRLLRKSSSCRPLGNSPHWAMDYFQWNFMFGFIAVLIVVIIGNVIPNVRITALGLPVLITDVCIQLLAAAILAAAKVPSPLRLSSVPKGARIRSGVYSIVEDIVAVDGGAGQRYREQLRDRWMASETIRGLFFRLDLVWGVSGIAVGVATIVLMFVVKEENVGFILGWVVPWVYAAVMALVTLRMTKTALRRERALGRVELVEA